MSGENNDDRRSFLRKTAMSIAAAELAMIGFADAQTRNTNSTTVPPIKPETNTTFSSLRQINAGVLNIGYAEAGPASGPVVVLLHGWPYDIYSYVDVAPALLAEMELL